MRHDLSRRPRSPADFRTPRAPAVLAAGGRPRRRATGKGNAGSRRSAAGSSSARFHGPSFSGGIIFGALLVLVVAYLPELRALLPDRGTADVAASSGPVAGSQSSGAAAVEANEAPEIRFEFEELLSSSKVTTTAGRYAEGTEDLSELYLQAASFRTQEEADRLRADLLLLNLPTSTSPVELADGRWIRVTVGPFRSPVQANRAMTALRNRNIAPIWIKRKVTG